ncbi:MAG: triose-phosphate isomerase [Bacteroidota bacterium]|nr:triose-phosphate isomerase [Bacteroidota bacterium]MDX5430201.1 triose-phosphate isomerase [Bacteroidota bacterium]MDX5468963.1 triose-phosphate isomerase [Bacteroidota bacterium]
MRKYIVAGNWKMNGKLEDTQILASEVVNMYKDEVNNGVVAVMIPPFVGITEVQRLAKGSPLHVGAQNCHQEESGAYTGEVSAPILASFGLEYVIIGHSERREYFGESNALLAQKVDQVLRHQMTPIYCVGETLTEREEDRHFQVIEQQITEGLFHLNADQIQKIVIAYEPVWAIGTGKTASAEQAQEIHAFIRDLLTKRYSENIAQEISILYGGSVKPNNAAELFAMADIDGGLIGGAALKSRDFIDICKAVPA